MDNNKSKASTRAGIFCSILILSLVSLFSSIWAQTGTTSPFSRYGIGMLNDNGQAQSFSMGGLIAPLQGDTLTPFGLNLNNPASLPYVRLTTYEAALINSNSLLTAGPQSEGTTATTLSHMALALPIRRGWTAALSLQPLSSVGYNISTVQNQDTIGNINYKYIGTGGFDKVTLSNGFKIGQLSLGINISYLFGTIYEKRQVILPSSPSGYFNAQTTSSVNASDAYLDYGVQYGLTIKNYRHREMRDYVRIVFGATFTAASNINVFTGTLTQNYVYNGSGVVTVRDTIQNNTGRNVMHLPYQYGIGVSLRKGDRFFAGLEYDAANWSDYQLLGQSQGLANTQRIVFGMQYTPAHRTENNTSYARRITYRLGFRTATLPVVIGGSQLPENAFTMGLALPVGFNRSMMTYNTLNVGLEVGQRGNANTMTEDFFNVVVGISINDRWFIKSKFD